MTTPPWRDASLTEAQLPMVGYTEFGFSRRTRIVFRWLGYLIVLGPLVVVGGWLLLGLANGPEARIADYVHKINRGDIEGAWGTWDPGIDLPEDWRTRVQTRRTQVTEELSLAGVSDNFTIMATEPWITCCCEPRRTNNPYDADLLRLLVRFTDTHGKPVHYVFDVWRQRGGCSNLSLKPPEWKIMEVFPLGVIPVRFTPCRVSKSGA